PVPGLALRPDTTYAALVLRRLSLGQSPALATVLAGRVPGGPLGAALARAFAPLGPTLRDLGIPPEEVAAATVFTTGDPTASLSRQVAAVDALPPLLPRAPLEVCSVYPEFTAL